MADFEKIKKDSEKVAGSADKIDDVKDALDAIEKGQKAALKDIEDDIKKAYPKNEKKQKDELKASTAILERLEKSYKSAAKNSLYTHLEITDKYFSELKTIIGDEKVADKEVDFSNIDSDDFWLNAAGWYETAKPKKPSTTEAFKESIIEDEAETWKTEIHEFQHKKRPNKIARGKEKAFQAWIEKNRANLRKLCVKKVGKDRYVVDFTNISKNLEGSIKENAKNADFIARNIGLADLFADKTKEITVWKADKIQKGTLDASYERKNGLSGGYFTEDGSYLQVWHGVFLSLGLDKKAPKVEPKKVEPKKIEKKTEPEPKKEPAKKTAEKKVEPKTKPEKEPEPPKKAPDLDSGIDDGEPDDDTEYVSAGTGEATTLADILDKPDEDTEDEPTESDGEPIAISVLDNDKTMIEFVCRFKFAKPSSPKEEKELTEEVKKHVIERRKKLENASEEDKLKGAFKLDYEYIERYGSSHISRKGELEFKLSEDPKGYTILDMETVYKSEEFPNIEIAIPFDPKNTFLLKVKRQKTGEDIPTLVVHEFDNIEALREQLGIEVEYQQETKEKFRDLASTDIHTVDLQDSCSDTTVEKYIRRTQSACTAENRKEILVRGNYFQKNIRMAANPTFTWVKKVKIMGKGNEPMNLDKETLAQIPLNPDTKEIVLENCTITKENAKEFFSKFKKAEKLSITGSKLEPGVLLEIVQNMPNLEVLSLARSAYDTSEIQLLQSLKSLKDLDLSQNKSIGNREMQWLIKIPSLKKLNLAKTGISDESFRQIEKEVANWEELKDLNVGENKGITDIGLRIITKFKSIVRLDLSGTGVKSTGLPYINAIAEVMERLDLRGTDTSYKATEELKSGMPHGVEILVSDYYKKEAVTEKMNDLKKQFTDAGYEIEIKNADAGANELVKKELSYKGKKIGFVSMDKKTFDLVYHNEDGTIISKDGLSTLIKKCKEIDEEVKEKTEKAKETIAKFEKRFKDKEYDLKLKEIDNKNEQIIKKTISYKGKKLGYLEIDINKNEIELFNTKNEKIEESELEKTCKKIKEKKEKKEKETAEKEAIKKTAKELTKTLKGINKNLRIDTKSIVIKSFKDSEKAEDRFIICKIKFFGETIGCIDAWINRDKLGSQVYREKDPEKATKIMTNRDTLGERVNLLIEEVAEENMTNKIEKVENLVEPILGNIDVYREKDPEQSINGTNELAIMGEASEDILYGEEGKNKGRPYLKRDIINQINGSANETVGHIEYWLIGKNLEIRVFNVSEEEIKEGPIQQKIETLYGIGHSTTYGNEDAPS